MASNFREYDLSGEGDQSLEASSDGNESTEENDTLAIPERDTSIDFSQYYLSKELDDEDHFEGLVPILSRLKKKEVWFIIGGKPIRFGMKEFAVIIGLNCRKYATDKALYEEKKAKDFLDVVMNKYSNLIGNDLKKKLESNRLDAQTKLKIAMVWFVHSFLCVGDPKRIVDIETMQMVTNWDCFNAYPWGRRSFEMTIESFLDVNLKKKSAQWKENKSKSKGYGLQGFPWAFMVWAFEAIPILGEAFGQPLTKSPYSLFPRLIRWYGKKKTPPDYQTFLSLLSQKKYLVNWENLEDEVDENIDRLTKAVDGVTQLIKCSLERPEFSVAVDHGRHETGFRRQPSMGVTEDTNVLNKLSQLVKFCKEMLDEMKVQNKKLHDKMDGLDVKFDNLTGIVDELRVQVENLSKNKSNLTVDDEQTSPLEKAVTVEDEKKENNVVEKDAAIKFPKEGTTKAKRARKTNPKYNFLMKWRLEKRK
ncbi:hypothetical protein P3L10_025482 [Capsicum annuum]|uniref:uncharacterized protein LOC124894628 n=1 Tax=Capsicum annuum TaxID=4072 RepID=UPI001FB0C5B0|nr:uncharacterized protein LOC124894628 [Capsicum annuum]